MNIELMLIELLLAGVAVIVLLLDLAAPGKKKFLANVYPVLILGVLLTAVFYRHEGVALNGFFVSDGLAWFGKVTVLAGLFLTSLLAAGFTRVNEKYLGAFYMLLTAAALGMLVLVGSKDLITLYVGLETATISMIGLTAIYKKDTLSLEAGFKYLVIGALSSGVLLYGISLIYAAAGSLSLDKIRDYSAAGNLAPVFVLGMILAILGTGFKLSIVPLHVWTPDVYQGAPTPVSAFISVTSKAAAFVFAIRLVMVAFGGAFHLWAPIIAVIALATMTLGNLAAIQQKNIKRLLAYSTISQAGYILVGFLAVRETGVSAMIYYLLVYTVTNVAAFAVVSIYHAQTGSEEVEDYAGLAQKQPLLALTLLFSFLSLAGIPPLAGYFGKYYLFYSLMENGYLWLLIAATVNSTISLYFYLLVIKQAYIFDHKKAFEKIKLPFTMKLLLVICIAVIVFLGVMPTPVVQITQEIAHKLFM